MKIEITEDKAVIDGIVYIKEKSAECDWKILSFSTVGRDNTYTYNLKEDGKYYCKEIDFATSEPTPGERIESVQYKGQMFTIGDVVAKTIEWEGKNCKITGFRIENDQLRVMIKQDKSESDYSIEGLYKVEKRPILFITSDGKEIKEGMSVYGVSLISTDSSVKRWIPVYPYVTPKENRTWFSTKQGAEEYINMNKKIYSKQEIINVLNEVEREYIVPGGVKTIKEKLGI